MDGWKRADSFLNSFGLSCSENSTTDIVSIIGAGGKTSLLFSLAEEARTLKKNVLITTTTKMWQPQKHQYDLIDLSGDYLFRINEMHKGTICVGGVVADNPQKITAGDLKRLELVATDFDLVLIEADGAAGKSLKAWQASEPVVPHFTTHTIGVVDMSCVGLEIDSSNIHRLKIYRRIIEPKHEVVTLNQLQRLINHKDGMFHSAWGKKMIYLNKMESAEDFQNGHLLKESLGSLLVVGGSVQNNNVYV